jgi:hypothetical protein
MLMDAQIKTKGLRNEFLIIRMKDLEPILNVLCNYQAGFVLSNDDVAILSIWLNESKKNKELFEDLGNWTRIYMGNIDGNPRERIQERLIENSIHSTI